MEKILEALKHAEERLNQIPHSYTDTNFALIREGIEEVGQLKKKIKDMAGFYVEKRSDVEEMLNAILEGKDIKESDTEHRYVTWKHKGDEFQYDTLTTLVSVWNKETELLEETGIEDINYTD